MTILPKLENLVYPLFGTNTVIGAHIRDQLNMLKGIVPPAFQHQALDDLGCGDGKITLLFNEIFQPRIIRGFDVSKSLVKRARARGILAEVLDLEHDMPTGELAVLWGVLHHLKDREACIRRITENYKMAFIREPVHKRFVNIIEMGRPLVKQEFEHTLSKYMPGAQTFHYRNALFVFYVSPK